MERTNNRLRAQRKFAQGTYIPPINSSSNGPNVPTNTCHRASSAQGPVTLNESSAMDLFTKLSLRRNHEHGVWILKPGSDLTPSLPNSYSKKKIKNKKNSEPNVLKKKYNMRNKKKSTSTNSRRDSIASDTPLSHLTIRQKNSVQESYVPIPPPENKTPNPDTCDPSSPQDNNAPNPATCDPSSSQENTLNPATCTPTSPQDCAPSLRKQNTRSARTTRDPNFTYSDHSSVTSAPSCRSDSTYYVGSPITRNKKRKTRLLRKPYERKTIAASSVAPVDVEGERSLPLEVSYNHTAHWVRRHHPTSPQKLTDPQLTETPQSTHCSGNQFKVPQLPERFKKDNNINATQTEEALEAPGRRLRSAKGGRINTTQAEGLSAVEALTAPASSPARASSLSCPRPTLNDSRQLVVCLTQMDDDTTHKLDVPEENTDQGNSESLEEIEEMFDFPKHLEDILVTQQLPPDTSTPQWTDVMESEELLVFKPSPEEFKNPMAYIKKVQERAEKYGMCKIVPPKDFNIPVHLDESVKFSTVSQYLGRLFHRWGPVSRELTFILTCASMLAKVKDRDQFAKPPLLEGTEVDLVKLYHLVVDEGGIAVMLAGGGEKWTDIVKKMGYGSMDYKKLEKIYFKYVLPYESLSQNDRSNFQNKVEEVWDIRHKNVIHRANYPLNEKRKLFGVEQAQRKEEKPAPHLEDVWVAGKSVFARIEECVGKGRPTNIENYRKISERTQKMRYKKGGRLRSVAEIERKYWRIVSLGLEHKTVLSGFIDTSVKNLGHPAARNDIGGTHPWNLKRLTENPDNVLSSLGKSLSVTEPTLSLNQLFSTNCWHVDPHQLTWIDVLHEGPTKIWYGIAAKDTVQFRTAMKELEPSVVQEKGIWLASDTTMVPPSKLCYNGVQLQRIEQNVGEYLIVFPGAYASSIATGLSISESAYVGDTRYMDRIDATFRQMRIDSEPTMFSNTMLLMRMATNPNVNLNILSTVHALLYKIFEEEADGRREAKKFKCPIEYIPKDSKAKPQWPVSWPYQEECFICQAPLILSKSVLYKNTRELMCLKHALRVYSCAAEETRGPPPPVKLLYSTEELKTHMGELQKRLFAVDVLGVSGASTSESFRPEDLNLSSSDSEDE